MYNVHIETAARLHRRIGPFGEILQKIYRFSFQKVHIQFRIHNTVEKLQISSLKVFFQPEPKTDKQ